MDLQQWLQVRKNRVLTLLPVSIIYWLHVPIVLITKNKILYGTALGFCIAVIVCAILIGWSDHKQIDIDSDERLNKMRNY